MFAHNSFDRIDYISSATLVEIEKKVFVFSQTNVEQLWRELEMTWSDVFKHHEEEEERYFLVYFFHIGRNEDCFSRCCSRLLTVTQSASQQRRNINWLLQKHKVKKWNFVSLIGKRRITSIQSSWLRWEMAKKIERSHAGKRNKECCKVNRITNGNVEWRVKPDQKNRRWMTQSKMNTENSYANANYFPKAEIRMAEWREEREGSTDVNKFADWKWDSFRHWLFIVTEDSINVDKCLSMEANKKISI